MHTEAAPKDPIAQQAGKTPHRLHSRRSAKAHAGPNRASKTILSFRSIQPSKDRETKLVAGRMPSHEKFNRTKCYRRRQPVRDPRTIPFCPENPHALLQSRRSLPTGPTPPTSSGFHTCRHTDLPEQNAAEKDCLLRRRGLGRARLSYPRCPRFSSYGR